MNRFLAISLEAVLGTKERASNLTSAPLLTAPKDTPILTAMWTLMEKKQRRLAVDKASRLSDIAHHRSLLRSLLDDRHT